MSSQFVSAGAASSVGPPGIHASSGSASVSSRRPFSFYASTADIGAQRELLVRELETRVEELARAKNHLQEEVEKLSFENEMFKKQYKQLMVEHGALLDEKQELIALVRSLREKEESARAQCEECRQQADEARRRLEDMQAVRSAAAEELSAIADTNERMVAENLELRARLQIAEERLAEAVAEVAELRSETRAAQLAADLQEAVLAKIETQKEVWALRHRLEEAEIMRDEIQEYNELVHMQKKQFEQENEALKAELKRQLRQMALLQEALEQYEDAQTPAGIIRAFLQGRPYVLSACRTLPQKRELLLCAIETEDSEAILFALTHLSGTLAPLLFLELLRSHPMALRVYTAHVKRTMTRAEQDAYLAAVGLHTDRATLLMREAMELPSEDERHAFLQQHRTYFESRPELQDWYEDALLPMLNEPLPPPPPPPPPPPAVLSMSMPLALPFVPLPVAMTPEQEDEPDSGVFDDRGDD